MGYTWDIPELVELRKSKWEIPEMYLDDETSYRISVWYPKLGVYILHISPILLLFTNKSRTGHWRPVQQHRLRVHPSWHQREVSPAQFPWCQCRQPGTQETCQCLSSLLWVWGTTWRTCHVPLCSCSVVSFGLKHTSSLQARHACQFFCACWSGQVLGESVHPCV